MKEPIRDDKFKSFCKAAEPLIKWMSENEHPHHIAVVTATTVELFEGKAKHTTHDFLKD